MRNLIVGENVKVIGGKWAGHTGVIVKVVNRTVGKSGYKIYREDFGDYIHCLKKFVESTDSYLCKWVNVNSLRNVITQSLNPKDDATNLSLYKNVLVTDEWEEDGKIVVNVVYQGNFAVLPKADVEVTETQHPGLV
ncbi:SH3 domain protein [Klebsiella phage Metamorpho]|nr:SH3 domain protein [Klebsiella phage Metamorpho]